VRIRFLSPGLGNMRDPRVMMSGEQKPGNIVKFNIDVARKALQTEGPKEALFYLEGMIEAHLEKKDIASAKLLLSEADAIIRTSNEPGLFHVLLRIGAYHFVVGQTGEAKELFDRVMQEAEDKKDDNIWVAAAATFIRLNEFTEAIRSANRIEDQRLKFSVFIDLADLLAKLGSMAEARFILLNYCAKVARSHADNDHWEKESKIAQLLIVAEKLVKISANQKANSILDELIEFLPKSWPSMSHFQIEKREEIAVLLVKSGQRAKAIDLMTTGWLTEKYLATLGPEDAQDAKMQVIDSHWKKLSLALKG